MRFLVSFFFLLLHRLLQWDAADKMVLALFGPFAGQMFPNVHRFIYISLLFFCRTKIIENEKCTVRTGSNKKKIKKMKRTASPYPKTYSTVYDHWLGRQKINRENE